MFSGSYQKKIVFLVINFLTHIHQKTLSNAEFALTALINLSTQRAETREELEQLGVDALDFIVLNTRTSFTY